MVDRNLILLKQNKLNIIKESRHTWEWATKAHYGAGIDRGGWGWENRPEKENKLTETETQKGYQWLHI